MANTLDILLKAKGGDQAKSEMGKVNKSASETTQVFKTLGTMLTVGIVAKGFSDLIKAYTIQETAITKLNASLKAQGVFSEGLSKRLQDQASALQQVTTFGDEAILSGQAFAMSMGVSVDLVEKMTPGVLNFASAMGLDLQSAFKIVGQAAAGEVSMLKRYGIILTDSQVKNKDFNAVLNVMEKNFKGTAEAVAKSGIGPMEQFKNTIGDVKERLGAALIPALNDLIKSVKEYLPIFEKVGLGLVAIASTTIEGIANIADIISKVSKGKFKEAFADSVRHGKNIENTWKRTTERMLEIEKEASKKSIEITKLTQEEEDLLTAKKIDRAIASETKRYEDYLEKEKERIKKIKETEKEEYDTRRELGELNLQQILTNLEKEIEAEEEGSEKRRALELAVTEYKHALRLEDAARIAEVQNAITSNLQTNLSDMLLGEKTFGEGVEGVWDNLKQTIISTIAKTVIEEKAAAAIRVAAEQAVIAAKAISAYAGIPVVGLVLGVAAVAAMISEVNKHTFQGGGTVPGAEGVPVQATVHGGEEIITPQQKRSGAGKSISIQGIYIQFPNVTTFSDWMNASPALVKQVTERKILQALSTLEDEGKIKEGTVLI